MAGCESSVAIMASARAAFGASPVAIPPAEDTVCVPRLFYITTPRCHVVRDAQAEKTIHHG